jgi:L-threonylcarbamoyladenylate synthase
MKEMIEAIKSGKIFIYPTDTVYGIGCNALNEKAVERIKEIKGRDANKPMSIIAPSKEWIHENTEAKKEVVDKYLPGKYTLILRKKDKNFLNSAANGETLGVRLPDCDFTELVKLANVPFITTSANLSGEKTASEIKEISKEVLDKVDMIIDEGKLDGTPSTIVLEDGSLLKRKT